MRVIGWSMAVVGLLMVAACSDDSVQPPRIDSGQDQQVVDSAVPDLSLLDVIYPDSPAVTTATISFTIMDMATKGPLDGVKACVQDHASIPCVTTGTTGLANLSGVPVAEDVMVTLNKSGYNKIAVFHGKGTYDAKVGMYLGPASAYKTQVLTELGLTMDSTAGTIAVTVVPKSASPDGKAVTIEPAAGKGPYYKDSAGKWSKALTVTSSNGSAYFFNVPPGEYKVTVSKASQTCEIYNAGWKGTTSTARVKVIADTFSTQGTYCC